MTDYASGAPAVQAWYALRVRSNREWVVQRALGLRGIPEYLPLHARRVQWVDRVSFSLRPLFIGYIFAKLFPEETASVLTLPGVVHLLPSSLEPAAIPTEQIELIERLIASKLPLRAVEHAPGDPVTIGSGPLKGVAGVVVQVKDAVRLVVAIEMFGRAVSVELDEESLESCH